MASWQFTPFLYPLVSTFLILASLFAYSLNYLRKEGRDTTVEAFAAFVLGTSLMTFFHTFQVSSADLETKIVLTKALTVVSPLVIVPWVVFALAYTGRTKYVTRRNIVLLSVIPVATIVLAVTSPLHSILWRGFGTETVGNLVVLEHTFGWGVFVYAGYGYVLGIVGMYYLLRMALGSVRVYRGQAIVLLVGTLAPLAPSFASITGVTAMNFSMMSFGVSGVAFWFAVFRYGLLDVAPIARDTVVDNLQDPYLVLDDKGRVVDLNVVAKELVGDCVGESVSAVIPEIGDASEREAISINGNTYDVTRSQVERRGRRIGEVVLMRDITDLKEREEELEMANERLERFADVVSHDLRNPLTIAKGNLEIIRDNEDVPEERVESIENAHSRMQTMIEDVLSMARGGEPETAEVETEKVAREAWGNVDTQDAELRIMESTTLESDRDGLLRIFENLFRNSVEHGGESVTVEVGGTETGGFYVQDDGSGFDNPEGAFESLSDSTGLGMWIVNDISEAHGWSVTAENRNGARVTFET